MTLHYFQFSDNSQHFPQQFHNSTPNWTQGPSQRGWRGSPNTFRNFTPRGGGGSGGGRGFTPRGIDNFPKTKVI